MKQFNLDEYLKKPSRKVVTRDGRSVRIVCCDAKGGHPVIGLVDRGDYEAPKSFTKDGRLWDNTENNPNDLFFAPEKHEGWINVYRDTDTGTTSFGAGLYASREDAEEIGQLDDYYVATTKIEWEE